MTTKKLLVLCSFLGAFVFSSYADNRLPASIAAQSGDWRLVWEETFESGVLDRDIWDIEVDSRGGGNYELQFYTAREENVRIGTHPDAEGNVLILEARREEFSGTGPFPARRYFTSGRVRTLSGTNANNRHVGMSFQYGRIDVRVNIPLTANGLWPAVWTLGDDFPMVGWPRSGEIDIMEMGHFSAFEYSNIVARRGMQARYHSGWWHWGQAWPSRNAGSSRVNEYDIQGQFSLFTMFWNRDEMRLYLDLDRYPDRHPYAVRPITSALAPYFRKPHFLIMNIAVGGRFTNIYQHNAGFAGVWRYPQTTNDPELAGQTRITALNDANDNRARMYIDYIRVWQRGDEGERFILNGFEENPPVSAREVHASQVFSIFPNPVVNELHVRGQETPQSIAVFNILGTRVLEVQNTSVVDMSGLPAGNYILQITRTNGSTEIHRVSKAQ